MSSPTLCLLVSLPRSLRAHTAMRPHACTTHCCTSQLTCCRLSPPYSTASTSSKLCKGRPGHRVGGCVGRWSRTCETHVHVPIRAFCACVLSSSVRALYMFACACAHVCVYVCVRMCAAAYVFVRVGARVFVCARMNKYKICACPRACVMLRLLHNQVDHGREFRMITVEPSASTVASGSQSHLGFVSRMTAMRMAQAVKPAEHGIDNAARLKQGRELAGVA